MSMGCLELMILRIILSAYIKFGIKDVEQMASLIKEY